MDGAAKRERRQRLGYEQSKKSSSPFKNPTPNPGNPLILSPPLRLPIRGIRLIRGKNPTKKKLKKL